ncbi:PPOX class F420-dependent oxidoreductase [Amycolatopsis alba]|uniref:PPOX class F420-dependent oxidoreductase n=1 Tax=Amycolatopsis alba TaxID=76020 RepID=UPI0003785B67|nr:PPOX class F420-dependent oxidoreductase [Amycolatopsis alba]
MTRRWENRFYAAVLRRETNSYPVSAEWDPARFHGHKYCLVVSYRANGEPVATPVWFARAADRLYFRTDAGAGKVRRLRRNPEVLVGPCGARGGLLGPLATGRARLLDPAEAERAERELRDAYGFGRRLYERFFASRDGIYVELAAPPAAGKPVDWATGSNSADVEDGELL